MGNYFNMASRITLIGAYGRTYTNTDAMFKDWRDGKDFKICNGPYCSIRDISIMLRLNDTVELMLNTGERICLYNHIHT